MLRHQNPFGKSLKSQGLIQEEPQEVHHHNNNKHNNNANRPMLITMTPHWSLLLLVVRCQLEACLMVVELWFILK